MTRRTLYTLQSGFVTDVADSLIKSEESERTLRDNLYVQDTRVIDTDNYYDEIISNLFNSVRKDEKLIKQFEIREQILMAAYRVFGTKSILDWIGLQNNQRTVGYLHYRFLTEMLFRAENEKDKQLCNSQYLRLLTASEASRQQPGIEQAKQVLAQTVKTVSSVSMSDLLANWTRDTNGLMDLLYTLQIIFGGRHGNPSGVRRR